MSPSFFQEYKCKLQGLYDKFYTKRGTQIAHERQRAAIDFYENLLTQVKLSYKNGLLELGILVNENEDN